MNADRSTIPDTDTRGRLLTLPLSADPIDPVATLAYLDEPEGLALPPIAREALRVLAGEVIRLQSRLRRDA